MMEIPIPGMGISIINCLIFIMGYTDKTICNGNSHTWKNSLYIETGPWFQMAAFTEEVNTMKP